MHVHKHAYTQHTHTQKERKGKGRKKGKGKGENKKRPGPRLWKLENQHYWAASGEVLPNPEQVSGHTQKMRAALALEDLVLQ